LLPVCLATPASAHGIVRRPRDLAAASASAHNARRATSDWLIASQHAPSSLRYSTRLPKPTWT